MRLLFEITCIFTNCVLISLSCVVYAYPSVRSRFSSRALTRRQECLFNLMLVAPFGVFALGAVVQNQLHRGMLALLPGLVIVALFMIYPVACLAIVLYLEEQCRRRRLIESGWGRPVNLDERMKTRR